MQKDQALGLIALSDACRRLLIKVNSRLMQTISSTQRRRGVSKNARLFNETQRLLKETEQRNAELAVINSVQGLGLLLAKLEMQAIYDQVETRSA